MSEQPIISRTIEILQTAIRTIMERSKSYNGDGVNFEDYQINGVDTLVEHVNECLIRLATSNEHDKAVDLTSYAALMAAFIEAGCPQSRFSPIIKAVVPRLYYHIYQRTTPDPRFAAHACPCKEVSEGGI